jgi:hypothetical protein
MVETLELDEGEAPGCLGAHVGDIELVRDGVCDDRRDAMERISGARAGWRWQSRSRVGG